MLFVLEAAGLLVNRVSSEWYLTTGGPQQYDTGYRPVRSSSRLAGAIGNGLSRVIAAIHRSNERRKLIRELSARDDRLLADIGITREQIPEVAEASFERGAQHPTQLSDPTAQVQSDAVAVDQVANDNARKIAA